MSTNKQVILINAYPTTLLPDLVQALLAQGAQVREIGLGDLDALLDALDQGWMPVVLKAPPA